jgi:nitroreductase
MNVSEAVAARFSARAFLDRAVEPKTVHRILDRARRAPSGGNLQPWFVHVVTGQALVKLKGAIRAAAAEHRRGEPHEYRVYPPDLHEPYRSRRYHLGEHLYQALGIDRDDRVARVTQFAKNLEGFGAPVLMFFSIERCMGQNQWAHLGMFMQTVMLLAVEEGLNTCPQEAWSAFHETISEFLDLPEDRMFYCGMALGYADLDHPINQWRSERAPLEELVTFL